MGFGRSIVAEILYLLGLVAATVLACSAYGILASQIAPWWPFDPAKLEFVCFALLLVVGLWLIYRVLRRVAPVILRERFQHWILQMAGLVVGGVRGAWWAGLILLIMLALGMPYLTASIRERSMVGPRFIDVASQSLRQVVSWVPGHHDERHALIPSMKLGDPKLPLPPELQPAPKPNK